MGILKDRFFIAAVIFGLFIRVLLMPLPGFYVDVNDWFGWAVRLNEVGYSKFYSDQLFSDYAPGFLYVLSILGFLKNTLNLDEGIFYLLLKTPAILSEIILGVLIYKDTVKLGSLFYARLAGSLILFNPAFIFNSAVWGQIDGILALFFYLAIYFLRLNKLVLSSVLIGISFLIKPQTVAVLPLYFLFFIRYFTVKNSVRLTVPFLLVILIFSLPFFISKPFTGLLNQIINAANVYPYTSLFAFNFWGAVGFWVPDNLSQGISYKVIGIILLGIYWIIISLFYFKKSINIYSMAALATLGFYFLPTRIHERYLYPAIPFLILAAMVLKSRLLIFLTVFLSGLHFLNLYYVYVYYNEIYPDLPKLLYNPIIYGLLDIQGRNLSVLSTAIFVLISIVLIQSNEKSKKN